LVGPSAELAHALMAVEDTALALRNALPTGVDIPPDPFVSVLAGDVARARTGELEEMARDEDATRAQQGNTHTHALTHARIHAYARTHARVRTHARTHGYARTHVPHSLTTCLSVCPSLWWQRC
jgi:hypothetical protein